MFPIATMCRVLGVSTSGYYAWRRRGPSQRAVEDEHLAERIRHFYDRSDGTYGVPWIHADPSGSLAWCKLPACKA